MLKRVFNVEWPRSEHPGAGAPGVNPGSSSSCSSTLPLSLFQNEEGGEGVQPEKGP